MKIETVQYFHLIEASISELRAALDAGIVTSVDLIALYLNRIGFYDRHGICLNSVPVLNPAMFAEARAADIRRIQGQSLGPLDGIPYTAKDSYSVKGLTVASGSPAFQHLEARDDAFVISKMREAGAVLIGLTNMPPMAAGGMQRGVYGRAESPYNPNFLPAAYASGSSNGAGTATAASFAAFGFGEETWSSGRAPASNGGLVAYTPSRGVISVRGNWPLIGTMDVVVPYARSVIDLLEILNILVVDDNNTRGDFWRMQKAVSIPMTSKLRPCDYKNLCNPDALKGKRFGVPRMYINKDSASTKPIATRASVIDLWRQAVRDFCAHGAQIVEVDFPAISNYEQDRPGTRSMVDRELVPQEFLDTEMRALMMFGWDDFLKANADPNLSSLAAVNGALIFPPTPGALPDRYEGHPNPADYPETAKREGVIPLDDIEYLTEGLKGLEETRRRDFDVWLEESGLDAVIFPAVADVAPHDSDYNPLSADIAWRNGTWVANGNQAIRHLGIPTVTVPMGIMSDLGMPSGLTFAGRAYDDSALLAYAYAFDILRSRRVAPARTPPLPGEEFEYTTVSSMAGSLKNGHALSSGSSEGPHLELEASVSPIAPDGSMTISIRGHASSPEGINEILVFVNGRSVAVRRFGEAFTASLRMPSATHYQLHSRWRGPYGSIITSTARDTTGAVAGTYTVVGGIS